MPNTENKVYDLIIIGSGPAGLTAALYAARYKMNFLVLGKIHGGMVMETRAICNFPTYEKVTSQEFTEKLINQVKKLGAEIKQEEVYSLKREGRLFKISTNAVEYNTKKVIIASGMQRGKLNVKGEKELTGRGVSYCAICDASFFKKKVVAVVGGGNSALNSALILAEYAKKVYIIYRKEVFAKGEPMLVEQVEKNKKIEIVFNADVLEIMGKEKVEGVKLKNGDKLKLDGVFIDVGQIPSSVLVKNLKIKTNKEGYIFVDKKQRTNVKGVFVAGDLTNNPLKQIITACAEGAVAANSVFNELKE